MNDLPEPLTPADCDLRDFAYMPLEVVRLRDSELSLEATGNEFRVAVILWCASWHQVPAGSLPNKDSTLAALVGYSRAPKEWAKVKEGGMRGWVECSDGRLYHPVVAEKAKSAWLEKLKQRFRTECARIKKHCQRHQITYFEPDFDVWMSQGCPQGNTLDVPGTEGNCPEDITDLSQGHLPLSPGKSTPREVKGIEVKEVKTLSGKPDALAADALDYLNRKAGRRYQPVQANLRLIAGRLKEGATLDDCKAVIDAKVAAWGHDPKMAEYLRPETLFGPTKFAQYVGQLGSAEAFNDDPFAVNS